MAGVARVTFNPLTAKRILLGVCGSIACYKVADLASQLRQAGAEVDVILTESAARFVSVLTFQSVTGRPVYTDADLWGGQGHVLHIRLGAEADLMLIAPATANTLAKLAHGQADNLLTITALALRGPLLAAPAMDGGMYAHPATRANLDTLRRRGVTIIEPASGHLASGQQGEGRLVEPDELFNRLRLACAVNGPLAGRHVVVSAGGTQEAIDPVRLITNRSSGKQGFAVAQAALDLGARVTLIAGATAVPPPFGAEVVSARSAAAMHEAVLSATDEADALVMAAAVADFRPSHPAGQKLKKQAGPPAIDLEPTVDILAAVADRRVQSGHPRAVIGFAAESRDLLDNARLKLASKKLDLIVANDISADDAGFEGDTNRVTLLFADGRVEPLPILDKPAVAARLVQELVTLLGNN